MSKYKYGECIGRYDDENWIGVKGWVTEGEAKIALDSWLGEGEANVVNISRKYARFGFRWLDGERGNGWTECEKGRGSFELTRVGFVHI